MVTLQFCLFYAVAKSLKKKSWWTYPPTHMHSSFALGMSRVLKFHLFIDSGISPSTTFPFHFVSVSTRRISELLMLLWAVSCVPWKRCTSITLQKSSLNVIICMITSKFFGCSFLYWHLWINQILHQKILVTTQSLIQQYVLCSFVCTSELLLCSILSACSCAPIM